MALHAAGVLEKYGVELIGADVDAIERGENRERFKEIVRATPGTGGESARSGDLPHAGRVPGRRPTQLGYPVVVRPVVHDGRRRLRDRVRRATTCAGSPAPG